MQDIRMASKRKRIIEGTNISRYFQKKCDDSTENHSTTGVPKILPTVAASLG
jgi:hypothetical protein